MRISEYHNKLREAGRVPVEKVGRNKGVRRAWREKRRTEAKTKELADAVEALAWEKNIQEIDKNTEKLLSMIFGKPEDTNG